MRFNLVEKSIAGYLKSFPKTRSVLKSGYKRLTYFMYSTVLRKKEASDHAVPLSTNRERQLFFGYYSNRQVNQNGLFLLCATRLKNKMPGPQDRLDLLFGSVSAPGSVVQFSGSCAWNWQQGCMLQWLPQRADPTVIYNDFVDDRFVSMIHNLISGTSRRIEHPVYCVSPDNRSALTLNFSRLHRLNPAYGYGNPTGYTLNDTAPRDDGIWRVDLESGSSSLILTFRDLAELEPKPSMHRAFHKVNHLDIAPDGNRFMVIHRWIKKGVKYSRLLTCRMDGSDPFILADNGMVSHCTWKNDCEILSWARMSDGKDRYYLLTDRSSKYRVIGEGIMDTDGHPSYSHDKEWILTDTYPDKLRIKSLILYSERTRTLRVIGRFFTPLLFDGIRRCDLHPRWSACGRYVSFDSCHEGFRCSYFIDVSDVTGHSR